MKRSKRGIISLLILIAICSTCSVTYANDKVKADKVLGSVEEWQTGEEGEISEFKFEAKNNPQLNYDIKGYFKENIIYCFLPVGTDLSNLVASYESNTSNLKVNEVNQETGVTFNNFNNQVRYILNNNESTYYEVKILSSDIPTIEIKTENELPIISKEEYIKGNMIITGTENAGLYNGDIKIRGRGNSTWKMEKKPYKIKLNSKSGLLGMNPDKEWVLLANHVDKTLVRSKMVFDLAESCDLKYTPKSKFVDLIVNGEYYGNYMLCEQIKVSKSRVNIEELKELDVDENHVTGGYLLEIDNHRDADTWFETNKGVPIGLKSPKKPNDIQLQYIKTYINDFEDALYSEDFSSKGKHYSEYIDEDSFINWYIAMEIVKNVDSRDFSSIYLYKNRNGKLAIGPVWDFDRAAGNVNYDTCGDSQGWWIKTGPWYSKMFEDPKFINKVKNRYKELLPKIEKISYKIDEDVNKIDKSAKSNFIRWDISNKYSFQNDIGTGSYDGEVNYLKTWMNNRITWVNNNINENYNKKIIGLDRYETSTLLSKSEFVSSNTVFLVNGGALADGLTVTPLATVKEAPILLTRKDTIPDSTKEEIKRLSAKNVIIIGGNSVVGGDVERQLKEMGINSIERIGGIDRYETALLIAQYIDRNCYNVSSIVVSGGMGEADAMSIASIAARERMPIILVRPNNIDENVYSWLKSKGLNNGYVTGGTTVVSDDVMSKINNITSQNISNNRLGGKDRYETNAKVIERFYEENINIVYVSKGLELIDALTTGPVAARNNAPVVITNNDLTIEQQKVLKSQNGSVIIQAGGGISSKAIESLNNLLQ